MGTSCPNRIPPCPLACRASSVWDLVLHPPGHTPLGWARPALGTAVSPPSGCSGCGQFGAVSLWSSTSRTEGHAGVPGAVCWRLGVWGTSPPVLTHTHTPGASGKGYQLASSPPKCHRCPRRGGELTAPSCCSSKPPQRRAKQLPGLALPRIPLKWSRELQTAPLGGCGLRRGLCTPRWAGARCRMGLRGGPL